ncbi:ABC transporter ATP-binding protein [Cohnella zeiphila]|uniref:ABC transporter ATP-binding protein n=1 Tax=Cohnella zeiphila TaxID=2761120 RepID=A0A7X0SIC0_9BACL|nr:ABC transporter ATP-binding protein [Cohnella zeiphila]MBB6730406.1 ABC transporter ATP-binding protein [Cohnella zeiphila]
MEAILEAKEVSKRFRNGRGIRNVSFEIGRGEIAGLFGPNGAGKTTLLKLITGLIRPDRGTIRLFGCDIPERFEQGMSRVGAVIETADVYEYMSAYDQMKLAARFYPGLPKSRIDQVLEQVGLTPYRGEKAGHYSLGMKMRLALAGALLPEPQLVLLDEPTNGLDIEGIRDVRLTIERLAAEEGISFLISSHMIDDMGKLIDRLGIMRRGEMIRQGLRRDLVPAGVTLEAYYLSQIRQTKGAEDDGQLDGELA